jgi:hypothetical protein
MGEVIRVAFGTEREWAQTRDKTVDGLVTIGALFGDDEMLMRAKAALRGIEVAMTHSVQVLMSSIYDLCTSKLQSAPA